MEKQKEYRYFVSYTANNDSKEIIFGNFSIICGEPMDNMTAIREAEHQIADYLKLNDVAIMSFKRIKKERD